MKTKVVISKVAGVSYEGRQDVIAKLHGGEPCRIVPEPTNAYDPNALAVYVALPDGTVAQVGYVPRDIAATIAPRLDGEAVTTTVREVTGGFEKFDGTIASLGLLILVEYPVEDEKPFDPADEANDLYWDDIDHVDE